MRVTRYLLALALLGSAGAVAVAQGRAPAPNAAEEKAIREHAERFAKAFNAGDAKAVAELWTPDGEYIDESGRSIKGRAAIEKEYAAFIKARPRARLQVSVESVRFIGGNLAVEEGTTRLSEPPVGATSSGRYTVLHIKQDGKWQMASVQDLESAPLSNYENLRDLEPFIGNWVARNEKGRVEMSLEWIENRNFIRRRFTAYRGDEEAASGFEIIGIDPASGLITTWVFAGDGGVGSNVWTRDGKRWLIEASGTMPDGRSTSAMNNLTPVDKDTFTWRSTSRSVDGVSVQDTPIIRLERKT